MGRQSLVRAALAAVVVSAFAWVYASGAYERFDPATMRDWLRASGPWGGLLFIVSYSCLQPLGLNGLAFLLSAPLIWGPTEAFLLNWVGTVGSGLFSYAGARFMVRDWLQKRLPGRVRRFDDRLRSHGFRTVLLLRLIFYTSPSVQWALGVSTVRFLPFLLGSILGVAPFTVVVTLAGVRIAAWIEQHPLGTWPWERIWPPVVGGSVLVLLAAGLVAFHLRRRRGTHSL